MTTVVLEHLQHANSGSPDLTVGPDGNIGIGGVAAPSANLEIKPTGADGELKITSDANGGNNMRLIQGYNSYINASNNVYISAGGNTDMFNLVNGKVGIGTSSPGQPLEISTSNSTLGIRIRRYSPGAYYSDIVHTDSPEGLAFKIGDGSSVTERMRIDSSGRVTMPYQPSWGARSLSNTASSGGTSNTNEILRFGELINNTGNHYNSSTGVFTCPIAGRYFVTFSGLYDDSYNTTGAVYIRHNGTERYRGYHQNSGSYYEQISMSGVIDAATNDTIDIYSTMSGWHVGGETSCAGFLIG